MEITIGGEKMDMIGISHAHSKHQSKRFWYLSMGDRISEDF